MINCGFSSPIYGKSLASCISPRTPYLMRETSFIKQNKEKWKEFESILENKDKDPEKLNDLFIQITDDLSYSRTFYPNRSVRVYLNNLAQQVFHSIYKNKKSRLSRLFFFWTDELPQLVYESRVAFRISFFVFLIALFIGALSSAMDSEFPRVILGDSYVDMTIQNIESGDPMKVYKEGGQFSSTLGITINNIRVAFLTFLLGVFFVVGSIAILISNGIMVGSFQYFFYDHGLLRESALTIWMHGTLEISAIVIAGAAGITMGLGLVFPGTLSRIQSFQLSARRGLKIMVGIIPIFILAGFIEGYLTRYTETPDTVRLFFILACLAFIIGYFVYYPVAKARQGFRQINKGNALPPDRSRFVPTGTIRNISELFSDIFVLYRKYFKTIAGYAAVGALIYCLVVFSFVPLGEELFSFSGNPDVFFSFATTSQFFYQAAFPQLLLGNFLFYTLVSFITLRLVHQEINATQSKNTEPPVSMLRLLKVGALNIILLLLFTYSEHLASYIFVFTAPLLLLWMYLFFAEDQGFFQGLSRGIALLQKQYGRVLGLCLLLGALSMVFFNILHSSLLWLYFDVITWNVSLDEATLERVQTIMATFSTLFMMGLIAAMFLKGMALQYYTLLEIREAPGLQQKVQGIGVGERIQGMVREGS